MTKHKCAPLRLVVRICTGIAAFCFLSYLLSVITHAGTVFSYALPIAACTVILLPPATEHLWQKTLPPQLFRTCQILYSGGVIFFTVTFAAMLCMLASFSVSDKDIPVTDDTVILVYGCRVSGEEPGEMLRERLDLALSLLSANENARVIVSGALDEGEIHTEGDVMTRYLISGGIDARRIYTDTTAESTKGNIRGFRSLLRENNLPTESLISVSSAFHMPRIAFLCEQYDLDCAFAGAGTKRFAQWFPAVVREYMAYVKMLILNDYS